MPAQKPILFDPIQVGAINAPNRIFMAPLTRQRSTDAHVPTEIMIEYYRQRAGAGIIITEGTGDQPAGAWAGPMRRGCGPRSSASSGSRSWRRCTRRAAGSSSQLWHLGPAGAARRDRHAAAVVVGDPRALSQARPESVRRGQGRDQGRHRARDRRIRAGGALGDRPGLRRGAAARRERLSDRPIPARRHQPPRRRIWRVAGKPHPLHGRGGGARDRRGRCRPHRHPPVAQRRDAGRRRQRPGKRVRAGREGARRTRHRVPRTARAGRRTTVSAAPTCPS